jgi:hypothetical protein
MTPIDWLSNPTTQGAKSMSEEQGYIDEMVRTRSTDLARPPWVQSHPLDGDQAGGAQTDRRAPAGREGVRPQGPLPGRAPDAGISDSGTLALHDATEDGIPICAVDWQDVYGLTENEWRENSRLLGPGPRDVRARCEQGQIGGQPRPRPA